MLQPAARVAILACLLAAAGVVAALVAWPPGEGRAQLAVPASSKLTLRDIPIDGARAYQYLRDLCALGPRRSGSAGMQAQQRLVGEHFKKLGGEVYLQEFRVRHPRTGEPVAMANLFVQWHPDRKERVLLCAHYDTRPFPDQDPRNPQGEFLGANDGASGTALLMELAHAMPQLAGRLGVDFVLFDGEEFVFDEDDPYFLGAEWFARSYVDHPPGYKYRYAVLLDMVGDADLQLYWERHSYSWSDTRPLVESLWRTAARLGVTEFVPRRGHELRDDHLKLHNIGKIPTCDIIDFDYPDSRRGNAYWHTLQDRPERCSALSLAKVGWVVHQWLRATVRDGRLP